ncbi:HU family DNA-binding protein [Pelobacter propionicus]|uniref:Histone family protein DNA-binding protein n=1 Tax=Pelobacter propionicus (strain DSM 2379 / NBRC 103807 / OttBd1) TaxID=338966 RepID=A1AQ80_PELPD|nr:HU family DNA-binding protein [Pelobacter propionicus]ABK99500.1 histone family protein DNA-binding protein [Pelobacter propionicus DSM 2379]
MTRSELVEQLSVRKDISIGTAEKIVQEIFGSMTDTLIAGDRIEIRGFGSFENRDYDERTGRNPKSGIEVSVAAKKRPFFKVGKDLKERIL